MFHVERETPKAYCSFQVLHAQRDTKTFIQREQLDGKHKVLFTRQLFMSPNGAPIGLQITHITYQNTQNSMGELKPSINFE